MSRSPETLPFRDREEAGDRLGRALTERGYAFDVVAGIPRGGVVVAAAVRRHTGGRLAALPAVKVAAPANPEFALGALSPTGDPVWNEEFLVRAPIAEAVLREAERVAREEAERRLRLYGGLPEVGGKSVLLVDDGLATGLTAKAAFLALNGAARRVVASPVASREAMAILEAVGAEVVVLATPEPFVAVGAFYEDFRQVSDEEVLRLLR